MGIKIMNHESEQLDSVESAVPKRRNNARTNAESPAISEANKAAVALCVESIRKDGQVKGTKRPSNPLTAKMRLFASLIAQGNSPREAYTKAYNAEGMSHASILANANKLMRDARISVLLESFYDSVQQNLIDDAVATRRKIMSDLLAHADNTEARLSDRLKSLELMGRAIGLFTDKTEHKIEQVDTEQLKRDLDKHLKVLDAKVH